MMTEEEAKKTWCPFARVGRYTDATIEITVNRDANGLGHDRCLCLGSGCQLWENGPYWKYKKTGNFYSEEQNIHLKIDEDEREILGGCGMKRRNS